VFGVNVRTDRGPPLLNVVTPANNTAGTFPATIDSNLRQRYPRVETLAPPRFPMRLSAARPRLSPVLLVLAAIAGGLSCGGDSGPSKVNIRDYIAGITNVGATLTAVRHAGDPPAPGGGGATVNITGGGTVINGGSAQVTVATPSGSFTDIYVVVEGVDGYYQLTLPAPVTAEDLLLTLGQRVPKQAFSLTYGIGSAGAVGGYATVPVTVIPVGTGEVQVSVSWNVESDVDLHVVEPGNEEVFYGNPQSAAGGVLDLDSNPACSIDGKKNENITWTNAPSGSYTVRVDYYDSCGETATDYVVTVQRKGHAPETFTGSFTGPGDAGGAGSGTQITTFTFP